MAKKKIPEIVLKPHDWTIKSPLGRITEVSIMSNGSLSSRMELSDAGVDFFKEIGSAETGKTYQDLSVVTLKLEDNK